MFGLFGGDKGKVAKLRNQYKEIRQAALHRMNAYQQYNFG